MRFEWDEAKNSANQAKHGISFEEGKEIFEDPLHISLLDARFGYFEERWITIGAAGKQALLVAANLSFTAEGEEVIRIISARKAAPQERMQYEHP